MSFAPKDYLAAYNTSGNTIVFGVPGSTSQAVTALNLTSGGTYTSVPTVTATNSPASGVGFSATALMGINSVSITPQILNSPVSFLLSGEGAGATFAAAYGAPDITGVIGRYINPAASPSISIGPSGTGATYQIAYGLAKISVTPGSPHGTYTSEPTVTVGGSGGGAVELTYGFTASHSAGIFGPIFASSCAPDVPELLIWNGGDGSGFAASTSYRPRMFSQASGPGIYWHTADTPPTVSKNSSFSVTGTGASFVPKYAIGRQGTGINVGVEVVNAGSGYDTTVNGPVHVEFRVGSPAVTVLHAQIFDDGAGSLQMNDFAFTEAWSGTTPGAEKLGNIELDYVGYFDTKPSIVLSNQGGGSGAVLNVNLMKLIRVENTSGSGYTSSDIQGFTQTGKLQSTGLKEANGTPIAIDQYFTLSHGEAISTSVTNEGTGYPWGAYLYWSGPNWSTISNGVSTPAAALAITSAKKIKTAVVSQPGSYTSIPSFSVTTPASGSAPTLSLASAQIASVSNTARGTGYSASPSLVASGFYEDINLTAPATLGVTGPWLSGINVVSAGTGYTGGDILSFGQGVGTTTLKVVGFSLNSGGIGYLTTPTIGFSGGGQTVAAVATATLGNLVTTALPSLTLSDINLTTGDARKVFFALAEAFYQIFSPGTFQRVSATRAISFNSNLERQFTYTFSFNVKLENPHTLKSEA